MEVKKYFAGIRELSKFALLMVLEGVTSRLLEVTMALELTQEDIEHDLHIDSGKEYEA